MQTPTPNHLPRYQLSQWAKWFANDRHFHAFALDQETLELTDKFQKKHQHHVLSIQPAIGIESGWFWNTLLISQIDGQNIRLGGVDKKQSALLEGLFKYIYKSSLRTESEVCSIFCFAYNLRRWMFIFYNL